VNPHPKIIDRIIEGIRESHSICVVGHIRPDGDCVGSQLGLTLALKNEGKKVHCWNEDRIPEKYEFLDPTVWSKSRKPAWNLIVSSPLTRPASNGSAKLAPASKNESFSST